MATEVIAQGGLARLAERLSAAGARRVLLLVTPRRRYVDEVVSALAGLEITVFDRARVHVPSEVLAEAEAALRGSDADTIVALGGGAATGLGKALRLTHDVRFVAIPTTYSGSEMTSLYGITSGRDKRTGRDERVRPDFVVHDHRFTATMPVGLTIQSLYNALSHVCSMLFAGTLSGRDREEALATARVLVDCTQELLLCPTGVGGRQAAFAAAATAGRLLEAGKTGVQHTVAHWLGGRFTLEHAALHAALLVQFVADARARHPEVVAELEAALGRDDLEALLHDTLVRAAAPVALGALGVTADAFAEALAERPDLPVAILWDAHQGLRPTAASRRVALDEGPAALVWGPAPAAARRIVVAIHGRGANAGTMLRRVIEILGHDPETCVVALRASFDRWYARRYHEEGAGTDAEVVGALARVGASLAALRRDAPSTPLFLVGFSQGSCLALEHAARDGGGLAGVIAPSGARIGRPGEWAPAGPTALAHVPVLLGASAEDPYVAQDDLAATEAWLTRAGAEVERLAAAGTAHEITLAERRRAREMILGASIAAPSTGFGNAHESEALAGALPANGNTPRQPPFGLWAEQLSGTGFVADRHDNRRSWLYRVRPSAERRALWALPHPTFTNDFASVPLAALAGFAPRSLPAGPTDFIDGMATLGGAGSPTLRRGYAVHLYAANRSMEHRAFYDADGDWLIVPQQGALELMSELGWLRVAPGQIAIVPRGLAVSICLPQGPARGYCAEVFGPGFRLPDRGPAGANGLTDARHFRAPAAWYEDRLDPGFRVTAKLGGVLHEATQDHSPFDVVAWHGNHAPYVYDLASFAPMGNTRFDHPDPSIHTVLSAPLDERGAHALDLVVFVPRWDPTEGTFRPPYFHRNVTTEINGVIRDPDEVGGPFAPGSCFLTPSMMPHGVRASGGERARSGGDAPYRLSDQALWFQFESALPICLTSWAETAQEPAWNGVWGSHRRHFDPTRL